MRLPKNNTITNILLYKMAIQQQNYQYQNGY